MERRVKRWLCTYAVPGLEGNAELLRHTALHEGQVDRVIVYAPSDVSLFAAKRFRCTQLVVLVLRECLDAQHPARAALAEVNSRVIRPPELYERLAPLHCAAVVQLRVTAVRHAPF